MIFPDPATESKTQAPDITLHEISSEARTLCIAPPMRYAAIKSLRRQDPISSKSRADRVPAKIWASVSGRLPARHARVSDLADLRVAAEESKKAACSGGQWRIVAAAGS